MVFIPGSPLFRFQGTAPLVYLFWNSLVPQGFPLVSYIRGMYSPYIVGIGPFTTHVQIWDFGMGCI